MVRRRRRKKGLVLLFFLAGFFAGIATSEILHRFPRGNSGATVPEIIHWLEDQGRSIGILAVASGENPFGVVCTLGAKITSGTGNVYVDIDRTLVGFDFQDASRTAVKVAAHKTGLQLDDDGVGIKGLDIFFRVVGPGEKVVVQAVDGPSAGAATAVALIAALENKRLKEGVYITGSIAEDGSIGQVGGVFYKAQAAAEKGGRMLLVPEGQSKVIMYKKVERRIGWFIWTTYEPMIVDLNEWSENAGWGLKIVEVRSIDEAINLMLET